MSRELRQLACDRGLVAELALNAFPSRRFPLAWQSLAMLPGDYRESFGTRFSYSVWGRGWSVDRNAAEDESIRDAVARMAELHHGLGPETILGVASGGESRELALVRAFQAAARRSLEARMACGETILARRSRPGIIGRSRWLLPRSDLTFFDLFIDGKVSEKAIGAALCVGLLRLPSGGIVVGIGVAPDAHSARAAALHETLFRRRYLAAVEEGREQLMPRREWQRMWLLSRDAGLARRIEASFREVSHAPSLRLPRSSPVEWLSGPWKDSFRVCRLPGDFAFGRSALSPAFDDETDADTDRTWRVLWAFHEPRLRRLAPAGYFAAAERAGLRPDAAPETGKLREVTERETGWRLLPVTGEVPTPEFFAMLARREFPLSTNLRPREQLFAAADPDLWHEVIGHILLLWDPRVRSLYESIGRLAMSGDEKKRSVAEKLYWYVAEYGLVKEAGERKIFGAGLLASPLGVEKLERKTASIQAFSLDEVLGASLERHAFQGLLFEAESVDQVARSVGTL